MKRVRLAKLMIAVIAISASAFAINIDDFYVKKGTWQETMRDSVRKLAVLEKDRGEPPGERKSVKGKRPKKKSAYAALWEKLEEDFGDEKTNSWQMETEKNDAIWEGKSGTIDLPLLVGRYVEHTRPYDNLDEEARAMAAGATNAAALAELRSVYYSSVRIWEKVCPLPSALNNGLPPCPPEEENDGVLNGPLTKGGHMVASEGNKESLRLAIQDLMATFGSIYTNGQAYLDRLERVQEDSAEFNALKREALLANPLLDFEKLLMVRNKSGDRFPKNWETRTACKGPFDDELVLYSFRNGVTEPLFKAGEGKFIGDLCLYFDADKVLFTSQFDKGQLSVATNMPSTRLYGVFELPIDPVTGARAGEVRVVSPDMGRDIDNYYACYLPNDRIIFASTADYEGVPCVGGKAFVANLFVMDRNGGNVRRLTFDQDASWHPSLQSNGRVMYLRWEYTDSAHYFSRVMMTMNPDGTDQKAYYGSNSYWPNCMFYPRQIPGPENSSKFIASITGHHSHPMGGAACIFDVSKGRHEADGALQFLLGRGKKVEPLVLDNLCKVYSPKFYHSFPLSEKYFLTCANNSIYLVDTFDNMLLIKPADEGGSYWEPIPLRKTPRPPVIPDQVNLKSKETFVLIDDIYLGPGLSGVPRGTVKNLRLYRYEFGPRHAGGHCSMGMESGWDAKQIMGTVPVESDGSANFIVPANTPFAMQPLDENGNALQLMRSWTVGMPGERLSCVGCHESQNMTPSMKRAKAMVRAPSRIKPFYGPMRGFGFEREVQPVLDKYCVGCHDGTRDLTEDGSDKKGRYKVAARIVGTGEKTGLKFAQAGIPDFSKASSAYPELHPYVRRNGPEGDYHLLTPLEFHADTSELVQMLQKGHHNVELDNKAWARIYTWIDLNAPFNGTWSEPFGQQPGIKDILARRMELRTLYANDTYNPETIVNPYRKSDHFIMPANRKVKLVERKPATVKEQKQTTLDLDLGDGISMRLVSIPAGAFDMGSSDETPVEQPVSRVKISRPFYMGTTEVTLGQFRKFDKDYLNGVYDMHWKDQVKRGYYMDYMPLPVIRVSWNHAMAFCKWLSQKTGKKVTLPTEAQWEWACRAGTDTPLSYGDVNSIFSQYANMADITVKLMAVAGVNPQPIRNPGPDLDFELKDPRSDDNSLFLAAVGSYQPNPWGLYDMHGNAAEWTRSDYKPYPYRDSDGRNDGNENTRKVIRGGSWKDRPFRCTSSYRLGFPPWQRVFDAGFRVIVEE